MSWLAFILLGIGMLAVKLIKNTNIAGGIGVLCIALCVAMLSAPWGIVILIIALIPFFI